MAKIHLTDWHQSHPICGTGAFTLGTRKPAQVTCHKCEAKVERAEALLGFIREVEREIGDALANPTGAEADYGRLGQRHAHLITDFDQTIQHGYVSDITHKDGPERPTLEWLLANPHHPGISAE